jgi:prevent-host-death family protein
MQTVGVRELKAHLSRYLKGVRAGGRLLITDRGRSIAVVSPVEAPAGAEWAHQLVAQGRAQWNGTKPQGAMKAVRLKGAKSASAVVIEDRR